MSTRWPNPYAYDDWQFCRECGSLLVEAGHYKFNRFTGRALRFKQCPQVSTNPFGSHTKLQETEDGGWQLQ